MKKFNVIILFGMITLSFLFFKPPITMATPKHDDGSAADTLLVGTTSFGLDLDPQNAWDSYSFDIIQHVCEGLFAYDLGDGWFRIVPRLAADCGTYRDTYLGFIVNLRENITFHNGHAFNASVVKASFDRLIHLIEMGIVQTAELYKPLNGELVINRTEVIDEFTIEFILNYPYAPFIDLLCSCSSMIIDASIIPTDDIIPPNGALVGTGPYRFIGNDGENVEFSYYEDYYRGVPAVKNFTYIKYESTTAISTALLAGDVHIGGFDPNFLESFELSDILKVEEPKSISYSRARGSVGITYLGMNNKQIDKTIRQAISYAMDYDYIIETIYGNLIYRMKSVVPPGIRHSCPQEVAIYDEENARQILIDAGLSKGLNEDSKDSEWESLAESDDPVASYNYTYNLGNVIQEDVGIETQKDLKQIGIEVELTGVTSIEFLAKLHSYRDELQLYLFDWKPDYRDPSNIINILFSNTSSLNNAQVNDPWLQVKMMEALPDFNWTKRALLYQEIQNYITTNLMPWVFIGFDKDILVHSVYVSNTQRNIKGYFYVFPFSWYGENATWNQELYCDCDGIPIECPEIGNTNNNFVIIGVGAVIFFISIIIVISIFRSKKS